MTFRKILLCLLTLFGIQTLYAECCCLDECGYFNRWYVGIAGGEATNLLRARVANAVPLTVDTGTIVTTVSDSTTVSMNNYKHIGWGEIIFGIGRQLCPQSCNSPYLGLRLAGNFSEYNFTSPLTTVLSQLITDEDGTVILSSNATTDLKIKTRLRHAEFTLDAKPGVVVYQKSLIFGLIGFAINRPRSILESTVSSSVTLDGLPAVTSVLTFRDTHRGRSVHFRWGFGLEQMITCRLSLNAMYTYTNYGRVRLRTVETTARVRNIRRVLSLGVSYYF